MKKKEITFKTTPKKKLTFREHIENVLKNKNNLVLQQLKTNIKKGILTQKDFEGVGKAIAYNLDFKFKLNYDREDCLYKHPNFKLSIDFEKQESAYIAYSIFTCISPIEIMGKSLLITMNLDNTICMSIKNGEKLFKNKVYTKNEEQNLKSEVFKLLRSNIIKSLIIGTELSGLYCSEDNYNQINNNLFKKSYIIEELKNSAFSKGQLEMLKFKTKAL